MRGRPNTTRFGERPFSGDEAKMSEYQYYEWQTVDRMLTEAEQEAVDNLSCIRKRIAFKAVNGFDILDIDLSEEAGGEWIEGGGCLSGLVPLRRDIIEADYRCLYLAWLK